MHSMAYTRQTQTGNRNRKQTDRCEEDYVIASLVILYQQHYFEELSSAHLLHEPH